MRFVKVPVVQQCSSTYMATEEEFPFYFIWDNLSIKIHAFFMRMLTSLSVDEILLPKSVNGFY